jgi:hypothetical protein
LLLDEFDRESCAKYRYQEQAKQKTRPAGKIAAQIEDQQENEY